MRVGLDRALEFEKRRYKCLVQLLRIKKAQLREWKKLYLEKVNLPFHKYEMKRITEGAAKNRKCIDKVQSKLHKIRTSWYYGEYFEDE